MKHQLLISQRGSFKEVYAEKSQDLQQLCDKLSSGIQTLHEASGAVASLQVELREKEGSLLQAEVEAATLLDKITMSTTRAERKRAEVSDVRAKLAVEQERIAAEHEAAETDLAEARPALQRAEEALKLISPRDIFVIKQYKVPPPLVKLILDAVMVLQMRPGVEPVQIVWSLMLVSYSLNGFFRSTQIILDWVPTVM